LLIVDDRLLLEVLSGTQSPSLERFVLAAAAGELCTTGSWYWRLGRALSRPGRGALTRVFADLSEPEQARVRAALNDLPPGIGLLSLRTLVPIMRTLPGQLNLLTAEAIAAGLVLDATIAVTTPSELLATSAAEVGVDVETVELTA
jgi:hypothetical protein